jgi:hypothetical protein
MPNQKLRLYQYNQLHRKKWPRILYGKLDIIQNIGWILGLAALFLLPLAVAGPAAGQSAAVREPAPAIRDYGLKGAPISEPYAPIGGGSFSGPQVPESPDPLVAPVKIVNGFAGGRYVVYAYDRSAKFRIDKVRGRLVSLSGIFFDPAPAADPQSPRRNPWPK